MSESAKRTVRWCLGLLAAGLAVLLAIGRARPVPAEEEPGKGPAFETLAPGLELGSLALAGPGGAAGTTILRVDPARWDLELFGRFASDAAPNLTAREWARQHRLVAAINGGMYAADGRSHVGFLQVGGKAVRGAGKNRYESVAAFDPVKRGAAPFRIFDLDAKGTSFEAILTSYGSVVQNLRLIKRPGENRWGEPSRRWSEAALAEDEAGRALLIFCKTPLGMRDLNDLLLAAGLDITAAQHLEGGPPAQFYLKAGGKELELAGGPEAFFLEPQSKAPALPIPFVLGARGR